MHSSIYLLQHYRFEIREFYALTLSLLPQDCKYLYRAPREFEATLTGAETEKKTAASVQIKVNFRTL
jgi:hypothetical protein